jgi:hypothetical protein
MLMEPMTGLIAFAKPLIQHGEEYVELLVLQGHRGLAVC